MFVKTLQEAKMKENKNVLYLANFGNGTVGN